MSSPAFYAGYRCSIVQLSIFDVNPVLWLARCGPFLMNRSYLAFQSQGFSAMAHFFGPWFVLTSLTKRFMVSSIKGQWSISAICRSSVLWSRIELVQSVDESWLILDRFACQTLILWPHSIPMIATKIFYVPIWSPNVDSRHSLVIKLWQLSHVIFSSPKSWLVPFIKDEHMFPTSHI